MQMRLDEVLVLEFEARRCNRARDHLVPALEEVLVVRVADRTSPWTRARLNADAPRRGLGSGVRSAPVQPRPRSSRSGAGRSTGRACCRSDKPVDASQTECRCASTRSWFWSSKRAGATAPAIISFRRWKKYWSCVLQIGQARGREPD